tara:strand:- start:9 stop:782 length:774 start_codon:yes stop_codon:yes gene_type:complete
MKLFRIINLTFLLSLFLITEVYSAVYNATTSASTYQITITRIELCETGSTTGSCSNPIAIYDGGDSGLIDIASTTAGATAATLGNLNKATVGTSYTHMQVTMERAVTIAGGTTALSKSGEACYTDGTAGTSSKGALGSTTSSEEADTVVYMGVPGSTGGADNTNTTTAGDGTGTDSATGAFDSGDDYMEWRGALANTFVLKAGKIPTAKIAFGMTTALGFYNTDTDNNACATRAGGAGNFAHGFYAAEPDVTITLID